jgi:hypothetical protein
MALHCLDDEVRFEGRNYEKRRLGFSYFSFICLFIQSFFLSYVSTSHSLSKVFV